MRISLMPSEQTPTAEKKDKVDDVPGYMAFYESEGTGLEIGRAAEIERASWDTAILMGECFEDEDSSELLQNADNELKKPLSDPPLAAIDVPNGFDMIPPACGDMPQLIEALSGAERRALSFIASGEGERAQKQAMAEGGFLSDICDKINEKALELIGDILIECADGGYVLLEDYESEVKACLKT